MRPQADPSDPALRPRIQFADLRVEEAWCQSQNRDRVVSVARVVKKLFSQKRVLPLANSRSNSLATIIK